MCHAIKPFILALEPAGAHLCGWFELRVPCHDGLCRIQQRTEHQSFI